VKVQNALQTALQKSETNVQNTLQPAHDKIDARFRNQQRHHDKDMCVLYDQMTTFRREGRGHFGIPKRSRQPTGRERLQRKARRRKPFGVRNQLRIGLELLIGQLGLNRLTGLEDIRGAWEGVETVGLGIITACRLRRSHRLH